MFCGCGGSSQGASQVEGVAVRYALNHWKLAIESHNTNHPQTLHDCADISETHPGRYGATTGLIASPECTNHSLAKGQRRKNLHQQDIFQQSGFDATAVRSRATMWDVPRFAEYHQYSFVIVENVVDVRLWVMFEAWLKAMHALGYRHELVFLNAMFAHGPAIRHYAPQSRDRIYIVFWKKGGLKPDLTITPKAPCPRCGEVEAFQRWKPGRRAGKYRAQYVYMCPGCGSQVEPYYYAAINAIDVSLPMTRIGDRQRPLSPKTMQRIQTGLERFGLRQGLDPAGRPLPPSAILTLRGSRHLSGIDAPMATQVAAGIQNALIADRPFLTPFYGNSTPASVVAALPTATTRDRFGYVEARQTVSVEDCYFRMLRPSETARAQGFPDEYIILGNQEQQQKQIGNANPPNTMELLVQRCVEALA